jgi:hypothetical protein
MKVGTLIRKKSTNMVGVVVKIDKPNDYVTNIHWMQVLFQNGKVWGCWSSECVIL